MAERARLARPLLKRATHLLEDDIRWPLSYHPITVTIAALTLKWSSRWPAHISRLYQLPGPRLLLPSGQATSVAAIPALRLLGATALIAAGRHGQLLAEPEFERAAISPDRLLDRLTSWTAGPRSAATLPLPHQFELGFPADSIVRREPEEQPAHGSRSARPHHRITRRAR